MAIDVEDRTLDDNGEDPIDEATKMLAAYLHGTINQVRAMDQFPVLHGEDLGRAVLNACQALIDDVRADLITYGYEIVKTKL